MVSFSHFWRMIFFHPCNLILFPSLGITVLVVPALQSTALWSRFPLFLNGFFNRAGLVGIIWIDDKRRRFLKTSTKTCLIGAYQGLDHVDSLPTSYFIMGQDCRVEGTVGSHFVDSQILGINLYHGWIKHSVLLSGSSVVLSARRQKYTHKCRCRSYERGCPSRDPAEEQNVPGAETADSWTTCNNGNIVNIHTAYGWNKLSLNLPFSIEM